MFDMRWEMEKAKFDVQRSDVLLFLDGHRFAGELIANERAKRLQQLTREESFFEYDSLCGMCEARSPKDGIEMLERRRISFLLERRKTMNRLGGGFGADR